MTPQQLQLVRRLHHDAAGLPYRTPLTIPAGDVIHLISVIHAEEKRADVAEARLKTILIRAAEENCEQLLIGHEKAPETLTAATAE